MSELLLVVRWSDGRVDRQVVTQSVIRIGKANDNTLIVPASFEGIADHHAEIRLNDETYTIIDLGGPTGTFVDGQRVLGQLEMDIGRGMTQIGSPEKNQVIRLFLQRSGLSHTTHDAVIMKPSRPNHPKIIEALDNAALLSARFPSGQEVTFSLEKRVTLVGRSPIADVIIPADLTGVEENHFKIQQTPYGYLLTDLNSLIGTRINDDPIKPNTPTKLYHADRIQITDPHSGESLVFTFQNPTDAQPAART